MDIERLKDLRGAFDSGQVTDQGYAQDQDDILALIDVAIARQSVKSEDVRIALTWFEELDKHEIVQRIKICPDYTCTMPDHVVLTIITALQAYQPTTRKDRIVEEVAISKTETTSAKKIVVDIQLRPMLDELEVDIDDIKEYISKLD